MPALSKNPQWKRFVRLFRGLKRAYGTYEVLTRTSGSAKVPGRALTVRTAVTDAQWDAHFTGSLGLGIVPLDDTGFCWFGAIDIDRYDLDLVELEKRCAHLGLPLLPTRTKSGGAHLYLFGAEPLAAPLLRTRLAEWAIAVGYGGSEVFPKQSALLNEQDVGNWINMPYFGVANGKPDRYGILHGERLELKAYCDRAEALKVTTAQLEALHAPEGEEFKDGPPCLQSIAPRGFGEGSRNNGLFAVGVYLKKRYPDSWESYLSSYNVQFFKPPLGETEVKTVKKSLLRKEYSYACEEPPCKNFCNRELCRTREFGVGKGLEGWDLVIGSDVNCVLTDPPYWVITVNGMRLEVTAEHFLNPQLFVKLVLEKLHLLTPPLSRPKWMGVVNKILADAVDVEAPPDSSPMGQLEYHLEVFTQDGAKADTKEELLTGKPFMEEGMVYFLQAHFKRYLKQQGFTAFQEKERDLYKALNKLGVKGKKLRITGDKVQHVWFYPTPEPKTEDVEIPPKQIDTGGM